ncbi:alpha beta-hydrolase [Coniophora puteana RWD-64-598 SS2]|uniref:Alpha beta-hydrolase n=1 Tax=Coniophora puteana (strain RWD-64-598) TaxID=741705 RepID=A0A5M3M9F5_CONPW|nr:alpha beta-hydrolase [Coniophora puteana RWD-64-598 SS2]EIW75430.1 alpha beta-hydrolase [Coniophora puteana RWD-64-598 SS2]
MSPSPCSVWGNPDAPKRALLVHGITCSSQIWCHVAHLLVDQGYYVVAPDLLGHGIAPRASEYSFDALVKALVPYVSPVSPDLIIGHSLGGLVTLGLIQYIPEESQPVHAVIVDPPVHLTTEQYNMYRVIFTGAVREPQGADAYAKMFPRWQLSDAAWKSFADELCDPACVDALFNQHFPWTFKHVLEQAPHDHVRLTMLGGDLSCGGVYHSGLTSEFDHVIPMMVKGASHWVPLEDPKAIVDVALAGVTYEGESDVQLTIVEEPRAPTELEVSVSVGVLS